MLKIKMTQREAFTLIELLIVILLISLVYFLGFRGIEVHKAKPKALTPLNLKEIISSSVDFTGEASFLCLNQCTVCLIRPNINAPYTKYPGALALGDIKAFTLDGDDILEEIEYGRYDDQKICLKMDFYPNGSSTQLIVKNKTASYFLPAHLQAVKTFENTSDARAYWLERSQLVSDQGNYY